MLTERVRFKQFLTKTYRTLDRIQNDTRGYNITLILTPSRRYFITAPTIGRGVEVHSRLFLFFKVWFQLDSLSIWILLCPEPWLQSCANLKTKLDITPSDCSFHNTVFHTMFWQVFNRDVLEFTSQTNPVFDEQLDHNQSSIPDSHPALQRQIHNMNSNSGLNNLHRQVHSINFNFGFDRNPNSFNYAPIEQRLFFTCLPDVATSELYTWHSDYLDS